MKSAQDWIKDHRANNTPEMLELIKEVQTDALWHAYSIVDFSDGRVDAMLRLNIEVGGIEKENK